MTDRSSSCIMRVPPLWSTVRVNTLKVDPEEAKRRMEETLRKNVKNRYSLKVEIHHALPDLLLIRGEGPLSVQPMAKEVYVSAACGNSVLRGANVFAAGIFGSNGTFDRGDPVSIFVDLDGKCQRGSKRPYDGNRAHVGNGRFAISRKDLFAFDHDPSRVSGIAVTVDEPVWKHPSLDGDVLGDWGFAQNLPSVVCGHVLDPQPGEVVLDMCAAPGGKSTHLATLMKNQGRVVCVDVSSKRLEKVSTNANTLGTSIIECVCHNAVHLVISEDPADTNCKSGPFAKETFDRILLDAPCSGTGQRPRNQRLTEAQIVCHVSLQQKLLRTACKLLKYGGTLVYSTCSMEACENENQVAWLLKECPNMELVPQSPMLGINVNGLQKFDPRKYCQNANVNAPCSCSSVYDISSSTGDLSIEMDTIGFFLAKFVKR